MIFYKVTATIVEERRSGERLTAEERDEIATQISSGTEEFNLAYKDHIYCFVSSFRRGVVTCGIVSEDPIDPGEVSSKLFASLGIKVRDCKFTETVFGTIRSLLSSADRYGFIENDGEVLERFGLDLLTGNIGRVIPFSDNLIIPDASAESLYKSCDELVSNDTLKPELDRIFEGSKNSEVYGHPVHYMIESGSKNVAADLSETLLRALYQSRRLRCRRYCTIDVVPGRDLSKRCLNALYKCCTGGAITVNYIPPEDYYDDESFAPSELEIVNALCDAAVKYRNQVLTVFCLPRASEKSKKLFFESLGTVSLVEIKEDLSDVEKSKKYLCMLCRKNHVRPDKNLYTWLDPDEMYYPDDLCDIFDEWFNGKLRDTVFPQYKDTVTSRADAVRTAPKGTAYDELCEMVGLTEAKSVIKKALDFYKVRRLFGDSAPRGERPAMHMVFTGNPGTAKTTVARLFARIMKENDLLSRGHLVEVGRGDLVGKYVGWTAQVVKDKFKAAMGGVLFIDEAYSLVDDRNGSFGDEAINTIVQEMENRREDLVVIFAGYPDEMEGFLNKNPGIRSRIAFHVPFSDYSSDELCDIARLIGKSKGVTLTDGAIGKLHGIFETARLRPDFGNGRYVRNVIELSQMNQASRIVNTYKDTFTKSDIETIVEEDIEVPLTRNDRLRRPIGFTA